MSSRLEHWFFRIRAWIIAYDHAALSYREHLAAIEGIAQQFPHALESPNQLQRRVARSLAQYLGQRSIRPMRSIIVSEIISCLLMPALICYGLIKGLYIKPPAAPRAEGVRWLTSLIRYNVTPEVYHTPPDLGVSHMPIAHTNLRYLRFEDVKFLMAVYWQGLRLLGVPHVQWWFKIAKDIAWARAILEHFPAKYALIADECNCGLSVLTEYANTHGQELYVVQHGDLFFSVFTAFFEANRSYCWADFYVEILKRLKAKSDFRTYTNPSFMLTEEDRILVTAAKGIGIFHPSFYTLTTEEERSAFAAAIRALSERYPVEVRPHPAYFHEYEAMAEAYGPKVILSAPSIESAKQFSLRHALIIGTTSAAVLESLMLGREVISVDGVLVSDIAEYHFAYRMPNCTLSKISDLEQDAIRLMEKPSNEAA